MPVASCRTSRQSLGSSPLSSAHRARAMWRSVLAHGFEGRIEDASPRAALLARTCSGSAFSVRSQPFQPWRVGLKPNFASSRCSGRWPQSSRRSKWRRMRAASQLRSPVSSAMKSQSAFWG